MKFVFVLIVSLLSAVSFADFQPDLRVTARTTGPAVRQASGDYLLPVSVSVTNRGDEISGRFKMSVDYYVHTGTFNGFLSTPFKNLSRTSTAFTSDGYYLWSASALLPGRSISFNASIFLRKPLASRSTVSYRVLVDSCSGDEFMPFFCRIDESNERNNYTAELTATIP